MKEAVFQNYISYPLILDSLFAGGIKNTPLHTNVHRYFIGTLSITTPPLPIGLKVTKFYRKCPRVLKQGQSKVFQTDSDTHTNTKQK